MKNSLAIWYEKKEQNDNELKNQSLKQVHLNLWDLEDEIYLDIGIKTESENRPEIIKIYVPFVINEKECELKDLGKLISENATLITAIFNEDYNINSETNVLGCSLFTNTVKRDDEFALCWPDNDEVIDLACEKFQCKLGDITGSIISLDISSLNEFKDKSLYFRMRVVSNALRNFYHDFKPSDNVLNSAFLKTEIMDVKVNDKRTLPPNLPFMKKEIDIERIHFLLLRKASDDLAFSQSAEVRSRVLEEGIWEKYVEKEIKDKIIAYHWKLKNAGDGGQFYAKIKSRKSDKLTITRYLIYAAGFAILCNWLAGFLLGLFDCSCVKLILKIINYVEGY